MNEGSGMKAELSDLYSEPTRRSARTEGHTGVEVAGDAAMVCFRSFDREEVLNGGVCCSFAPGPGGAHYWLCVHPLLLLVQDVDARVCSLCACG